MTDTPDSDRYVMRISRMTVDKLGVRLYDRVSAVVAELVANAYDADAENVVVRVPLATLLARKNRATGEVEGYGHTIEVVDDGHGMTPDEANAHFLRVGKDRRADPTQGKCSRRKRRSVMGRKGIGKLAPFGICKRIEILSAGGEKTDHGFPVSHFIMPYDRILADEDTPVPMEVGDQDGTYRSKSGTTVRLIDFLPKRVPNKRTFRRQMARRFGLRQTDFNVRVEDTRNPGENPPFDIESLDIPLMDGTRVDVSAEPVPLPEEQRDLPVSGWMGLAKEAYKNEEMAGVRIYARGKIVGTTRVEIKAVGHRFDNDDWDRLHNYLEAFRDFFAENRELASGFLDEWVVNLVCDAVRITNRDKKSAYRYWRDTEGRIERISWNDFLARAVKANELFLAAEDRVRAEERRLHADSDSS